MNKVKLIDWNTLQVKKVRLSDCILIERLIHENLLNWPFSQMYNWLWDMFNEALREAEWNETDNLYFKIKVYGKNTSAEDLETIFSTISTMMAKLMVDEDCRRQDRDALLGGYMIPKECNLLIGNALKCANFQSRCAAFGFEVCGSGFWKKRMVK